jgi:Ca-activated chloride channel family protein
MNFNLAAPGMLWLLLLVVPPLVFFLWWAWRKRQELITQFISARLLGTLKVGVSTSRQKMRMALLVVAVVFLILALARPQWGYTMEEAKQRGLDIMVAVDTSNSMLAEDTPPNRLGRAKLAALDLMRRAKTDRLGLIAFAGSAFLQCPLTLDDSAFGQSVDSLDTHSISQGGTALADAIETAQKAFKDEAENHKVLVLFTDGEDHDSEAVNAAEAAAKAGMRIFTIGIGTPEGELLRIRDDRGRVDYIRDEAGNPVKSQLNEALLQEIATKSGGFYLPLRGAKTMDVLYEKGLAPLPKSTNSSKLLRRYHERFHWLVGLAIIILVVEMFLPDRQRRRSKATATNPAPLARATETVALLCLLMLPAAAWGSPAQALREYEAGKYQDALKDYHQLLEKKKDDPRLYFNAGAAAYQNRQLEEAAKQFNQALVSPDLQLQQRAYYNLGNTYFRLGQQGAAAGNPAAPAPGTPPEAKMKAWEQAVQHYESALKLNPQDEDAKFNRSFVQEQLEELKKQQQQQQQSQSKDKSGGQKNQDQKNQDKNDPSKDQDKQQQSQQKQDSSQQKDSQAQNQKQDNQQSEQNKQDKQDEKKTQEQAQKDKSDKKDQNAQSRSGQAKEQSKEEAEREAAMMAAGQMTPQQAQQLLDAQKGDEEVLRLAPPDKQTRQTRSFKNW